MNDALSERIVERRRRRVAIEGEIASLRAKLTILDAEIAAYEDAYRLVASACDGVPDVRDEETRTTVGQAPTGDARGASVGVRMSEAWKRLYEHLVAVHPREVTSEEIRAKALEFGTPLTSKQVRSVAWNHTERGMLVRVRPGAFRVTETGAAAIGRSLTAPRVVLTPEGADGGGEATQPDPQTKKDPSEGSFPKDV